jgi:hypothetical protein
MVRKGSSVQVRCWAWLCRAISSPLQFTVTSAMEALSMLVLLTVPFMVVKP